MTEYRCSLCGRTVHVSDGSEPICPNCRKSTYMERVKKVNHKGREVKDNGKKRNT